MNWIRSFFSLIWRNKGVLPLLLFMTLLIFALRFDFSELSDFVGAKVYELSQKSTYVRYDNLTMSLLPPKLKLEGLEIRLFTSGTEVKLGEISIQPLSELFFKRHPSAIIDVNGVFGGHIRLITQLGKTIENGQKLQKNVVTIEDIRLEELTQLLESPLKLKGKLKAQLNGDVDISLSQQPDIDLEAKLDQLYLNRSEINTLLGPLQLPAMHWNQSPLKGRWSAGKLQIENLKLGNELNPIQARLKGNLILNLQKLGSQIVPQMGSYQWDIQLQVAQSSIDSQLALILNLLDNFKSSNTSQKTEYRFRIYADGPYQPPQLLPSTAW